MLFRSVSQSRYSGETKDEETGMHHLAHAIVCLMFMLEYELAGAKGLDDRSKLSRRLL